MAVAEQKTGGLPSPWEFTVHVEALIKARDPFIKPGSVIEVMWYMPTRENYPDHYFRDGHATGKPALWLLRTERAVLRTVSEGSRSVFPLDGFSAVTRNRLGEWKDARLAVIYLVLKPGLVIAQERYASSILPADVSVLVPSIDFLKVYRSVYLESDEHQRGLISLSATGLGFCLEQARRVADAQRRPGEDVPKIYLDRQMQHRTDEVDLHSMSLATKQELLKELGSPADAVNVLAIRACRSDARVRERARDLLSRYFGLDTSTLPCLPCE